EIYNFITTEEFKKLIEKGDLYEYDIHHNHYYGTSKHLLNERLESGKIIVKDIDVNGTENLVKLLGRDTKIVTIFLRVPRDELLRRLIARHPNSDLKEITLRLDRFEYEESKIGIYDYVIKNNDLEKTLQIISTIIECESNLENPEF
ncbi:MAG: guanylate kinase, partial [Clostridia bacterium]